ncbi:MAG: dihydroorotate dehydrogenase [Candidatus Omnitrophica bacterium]|nr:dihydroorotate dehydrogenase [Candidatus Omnitrophota bacterium]HOX54077.1 dihydroorotate dehydrogenase [Candidatus Omnitrophota bacterium]
MKPDLSVKIGKLKLKNPVMVASGTFGYAEEFSSLMDLKKLGAIVTKTITLKPRKGNPPPRTVETAAGMLNAIGLENPGIKVFIKDKLPFLKKIGVPIIVSISADNDSEFVELAKILNKTNGVSAIELNLSCPNLGTSRMVSQLDKATYRVVRAVRAATKLTLITKLTPNVTDIGLIARAATAADTDAISLVNTFLAMAVDKDSRRPKLANVTGGLSGPAIKPIALRMVWEVSRTVYVPVIGMGGIMNTEDAMEFIVAGATAVAVGTGSFVNPSASIEIVDGIKRYLQAQKIKDIEDLIGSIKC